MQAALWPVAARGVLSHETALELWDVGDVNPARINITVPSAHRTQREVPASYVIHREDLDAGEISEIEGVPVVTLERAVRDCAADHLGPDLIEQAVRNGRGRGLLTAEQAATLTSDLRLERIPAQRS
jgi:predicted transcriptional regulator of viral defense system